MRVVHSDSGPSRYCSCGGGYAWKLGQSGELAVIKVYPSSKLRGAGVVAVAPAAPVVVVRHSRNCTRDRDNIRASTFILHCISRVVLELILMVIY